MKKITLIAGLCAMGLSQIYAQKTYSAISVVDSLGFMLGTWQGEGWIRMGPKKETFKQTEIISSKVHGNALSLDGVGLAMDTVANTQKKVHDAFGIIYFDNTSKAFRMLALSTAAPVQNVELKMIGEKVLRWSFASENGGTVRFTEDFSKENEWHTIGEYSGNGKEWFTFMQYDLRRAD